MASYALGGRIDEARAMCEVYRQLDPAARISNIREWLPFHREEDIQKYADALRLAGIPE